MPSPAPVWPRQMLPPPTTIAISVPSCCWVSATSAAMRATTAPSIPYPKETWANASPDSLSTTRCQRPRPSPFGDVSVTPLAPDLDLGEARDLGVAQQLLDGHLGVAHELLLEQHALSEEAAGELAFHDLGDGLLGFAFVARLGLQDLALLLHLIGRDLITREVLGPGEGDVQRE